MIDSVESYIREIELNRGELLGFRDFLEYTDVLCRMLGTSYGQVQSRQIVALAYAMFKLIRHGRGLDSLANSGIKGALAGTALKNAMFKLVRHSKEPKDIATPRGPSTN